jgi:hypothetical protein
MVRVIVSQIDPKKELKFWMTLIIVLLKEQSTVYIHGKLLRNAKYNSNLWEKCLSGSSKVHVAERKILQVRYLTYGWLFYKVHLLPPEKWQQSIMNDKALLRPKERAKILDDLYHCVIKRTIHGLYSRKNAPTVSIIHNDHSYITGDYTKLCLNIICNRSFFYFEMMSALFRSEFYTRMKRYWGLKTRQNVICINISMLVIRGFKVGRYPVLLPAWDRV